MYVVFLNNVWLVSHFSVECRIPIFDGVVLNADASIIGTPFYVMEMVEGRIFKNPALPELRYS